MADNAVVFGFYLVVAGVIFMIASAIYFFITEEDHVEQKPLGPSAFEEHYWRN